MNSPNPTPNMSRSISFWLMLLPLVAPGLGLSPTTLISQVTVSQLLEEVSKLLQAEKPSNAPTARTQQVPEMLPCTDDPEMEDCTKVVENDLCIAGSFYARYCRRSCILAGKIPADEPHLHQEAEADLVMNMTSEKDRYLQGSDITVSCFATGYPAPEIYWLLNASEISSEKRYQENVTDFGGILSRTIRSVITVTNYTGGGRVELACCAINRVHFATRSKWLKIDRAEINVYPEQPVFKSTQEALVTCVIKGIDPGNVSWNLGHSLGQEPHTVVDSRWEENGMTVVQSNVTIFAAQLSTIPKTFTIKCSSTNENYRDLGVIKDVYIIKDVEIPNNCTDSNSKMCFSRRRMCNAVMQRNCCKTCTLMSNAEREHSFSSGSDEILLDFDNWKGTSVLSISHVKVKDIGLYTCRATHSDNATALLRFDKNGHIDYHKYM
nr:neurofascin-like isoform X2 [Penaeus vannamei]